MISVFLIFSVYLTTRARPAQDDYASLSFLSNGKWFHISLSHWELWGGNVATPIVATFFNFVSLEQYQFLGLSIHSLLTFLLFGITSLITLTWAGIKFPKKALHFRLLIILVSLLTTVSIHSPALAGMFSFTWASTGHLWPIMFLIISLQLAQFNLRKFSFLFFFLGAVVTNFNITEGLTALIIFFIRLLQNLKNKRTASKKRTLNCVYLFVGGLVGFSLIIIAPGFDRRREFVGSDYSAIEITVSFLKSLFINSGDFFLHPGWMLAIIIGLLSSRYSKIIQFTAHNKELLLILCVYPIILFILTIVGATFAYPSWYQTLGIYLYSLPIGLTIGRYLSRFKFFKKYNIRFLATLFFVFSALSISLLCRDYFEISNRRSAWDKAYISNVCNIQLGKTSYLEGAEILYPPLNIGISDLNSRPWMKDLYINWIEVSKVNIKSC